MRGHVLAGALGIALACDLIVASENATFGTPEINVGAFPFMIMALIYRNVPRKKANELLLLGERWSAQEALAAGIVNRVVPAEDFDALVAEWAGKLAGKSPVIMRLGMEAMRRQLDMPLDDAWTTCAPSSRSRCPPRTSSRGSPRSSRSASRSGRARWADRPRCCAPWSRTCKPAGRASAWAAGRRRSQSSTSAAS